RIPIIACGMVGSAQGWREAPYAPCPARAADLAAALIGFEPRPGLRLHIVPGVSKTSGLPDVMRGEETQIFGAIGREPALAWRSRLVHPGTHARGIEVHDGAITTFQTSMTGELYAIWSSTRSSGGRRRRKPNAARASATARSPRPGNRALPAASR